MNELTMNELKYRIQKYIPYKSTVYISSYIIDIQIMKEKTKISITIPTNNNWEQITCRIDTQLQNIILSECPICENQDKDVYTISCNECAKKWCNSCYVKMIQKNIEKNQSFSCPFCRFCFEGEIPTFILQK